MNNPTKVYLAHPGIPVTKQYMKLLQVKLEEKGYVCYNPFDGDENARALTALWDKLPDSRTLHLSHQIVQKDLNGIRSSDIIVAYFPKINTNTVGTPMEIFYANLIGKNVFILTDIENPWLMVHGTVVKTEEELFNELQN